MIGPALLASLLAAAAVVAGGWALGMISAPKVLAPQIDPVPPALPAAPGPDAAVVEEKAPPDAGAAAAQKPAEQKTAPEPASIDAGVAAVAAPDAGAVAVAQPADAGVAAAPAPRRRKEPEVTQAALMHAVAISQVRRGEAALEKGQSDEALASFRAALDNEPKLAVAFRGLGMAYAMQNNDAQALLAYQKYLLHAPSASDRAEIRRSIAELKARAKIGSGEK